MQSPNSKEEPISSEAQPSTTTQSTPITSNANYQYSYPYFFNPYTYYYGYNVQQPFYLSNPALYAQNQQSGTSNMSFHVQTNQPSSRIVLDPRRTQNQNPIRVTTPFLLVTPNPVPNIPVHQLPVLDQKVVPTQTREHPTKTEVKVFDYRKESLEKKERACEEAVKSVSAQLKDVLAAKSKDNSELAQKNTVGHVQMDLKKSSVQNRTLNPSLKIFQKEVKAINEEKTRKIPKDLEDYVKRCFQACKTDNEKDRLENIMRKYLKSVINDKIANSTDWKNQPLLTVNSRKNKHGMKNKDKGNFKNVISPANIYQSVDDIKKVQRLNRFDLKSITSQKTTENEIGLHSQIVGLSTALEKAYLRLTTAADPSTVRPVHILKNSFTHVLSSFRKNNNYDYVLEQMKSIRQDLTIQGIRNDFTVRVYEENARLAILNNDRSEFNQCQTCLKQLYKEGITGNESEFVVYNILYLTYMKNHLEMVGILSSIPISLRSQDFVKLSIELYSAHINLNYVKFFKIYNQLLKLPLAKNLIDLFIDAPRIVGLKAMVTAFLPKIPINYIISVLNFENFNHFKSWMEEHGIELDQEKDLDCKIIRPYIFKIS